MTAAPRQALREIFKPGDIYEDCAYHPCFCTAVDGYGISGISLIDRSRPRACDTERCGVVKLTLDQALQWKMSGPPDVELPPESRWWR